MFLRVCSPEMLAGVIFFCRLLRVTAVQAGGRRRCLEVHFDVHLQRVRVLPGKWCHVASDTVALHHCALPLEFGCRSQIFNQINARSLTDDWNVYAFGRSSTLFICITFVEAGLQAILVQFGGPFTKTTGLSPAHWGISIGLAAFTFPLGVAMRFIPVPPKLPDYAAFYQEEFAVRRVAQMSVYSPPTFVVACFSSQARMDHRRSHRLATGDAVERVFMEGPPIDTGHLSPLSTTTESDNLPVAGPPALRTARSFALPPLLPRVGVENDRTTVDMTGVQGAAPLATESDKVVALRPSARLPPSIVTPSTKASPHRSNKTVYPVSRERFAAAAQLASAGPS